MTTEELIFGHFDRVLTPEQESILQQRLSASPEARAMYDQHRNLDGYLNNDVMALAPSARLDEMTIAAALSAVPEAIGSGSGAWFSGKMIATLSAIVIGGASIALLTTSGPSQSAAPAPAANAPLVRTLPATPSPAALPAQNAPAAQATATKPTESPAPAAAVSEHHAGTRATTSAAGKVREGHALRIPTGATNVTHGITTEPNK